MGHEHIQISDVWPTTEWTWMPSHTALLVLASSMAKNELSLSSRVGLLTFENEGIMFLQKHQDLNTH
jgi:hypothetical protein